MSHPDQETHERVAQAVVTLHPELVRLALETGNYLPLIRAALNMEPGVVRLWMAQRIGQIVRSKPHPSTQARASDE